MGVLSPWRNWQARSAVNRKDVGSSPTGDERLFIFLEGEGSF